jgi:hypothetical protein
LSVPWLFLIYSSTKSIECNTLLNILQYDHPSLGNSSIPLILLLHFSFHVLTSNLFLLYLLYLHPLFKLVLNRVK